MTTVRKHCFLEAKLSVMPMSANDLSAISSLNYSYNHPSPDFYLFNFGVETLFDYLNLWTDRFSKISNKMIYYFTFILLRVPLLSSALT